MVWDFVVNLQQSWIAVNPARVQDPDGDTDP